MSMAYLLSWQGPVPESADPYGDGVRTGGLEAAVHVQEIQLSTDRDYEKIKRSVYETGGVQSSIYTDLQGAYSTSPYYNPDTAAYRYNGELEPNHDVVIVGWDDRYPRENFTIPPEGGRRLPLHQQLGGGLWGRWIFLHILLRRQDRGGGHLLHRRGGQRQLRPDLSDRSVRLGGTDGL